MHDARLIYDATSEGVVNFTPLSCIAPLEGKTQILISRRRTGSYEMDDVYICSLPVVETIAIEDVSPNPIQSVSKLQLQSSIRPTADRGPSESYHVAPIIIFLFRLLRLKFFD